MERSNNTTELGARLFSKLRDALEKAPKQQKKVCHYILENYQEVSFMTVQLLAEKAGVSTATVIRTVNGLGYSSFILFQKQLHELIISTNASVWWSIEKSLSPRPDGERNALERVTEDNIKAISEGLSEMNIDCFKNSAKILSEAKNIHVLALRTSRAAAMAFYSLSHQFLSNVKLPTAMGSEHMYEYLIDLTPQDVLLAISIGGPHYAIRTIDAIKYANSKKVPVILITDSISNPAVEYAKEVISITTPSDHYSLTPVITVLDALLVEIGNRKRDKVIERLHSMEKLLVQQKING